MNEIELWSIKQLNVGSSRDPETRSNNGVGLPKVTSHLQSLVLSLSALSLIYLGVLYLKIFEQLS